MIKYIASDLDGTLLHGGAQNLSNEVFDLIRRLKEQGIRFIAASGRQYNNIYRMFGPVQDDISYIAENGSLCIHDHEVISRGFIERELGLRIIDYSKKYKGCNCLLSCEGRCYTDSGDDRFISHIKNVVKYDMDVVEDLHEVSVPFLKLAMCDFEHPDRLLPFFQEHFKQEIKVVTSGNIWIDFIAPNANKGTALAGLLHHLGFDPADGVTFGDQYNDAEMLSLAGTSYAMVNGNPGLRKYATGVTDSVEKILYDILEASEGIS